jgi:hypothetical protein
MRMTFLTISKFSFLLCFHGSSIHELLVTLWWTFEFQISNLHCDTHVKFFNLQFLFQLYLTYSTLNGHTSIKKDFEINRMNITFGRDQPTITMLQKNLKPRSSNKRHVENTYNVKKMSQILPTMIKEFCVLWLGFPIYEVDVWFSW